MLDTCFNENCFNELDRRSSNISNFISSRLQVFGHIDVLKKLCKVHRKTPVLECILIKIQAPNIRFEILIKKEKPVLPCEFCKNFKNKFFIEQLRASVILTLLKYYFQFLSTFHQPFKEFIRLNKVGIIGE